MLLKILSVYFKGRVRLCWETVRKSVIDRFHSIFVQLNVNSPKRTVETHTRMVSLFTDKAVVWSQRELGSVSEEGGEANSFEGTVFDRDSSQGASKVKKKKGARLVSSQNNSLLPLYCVKFFPQHLAFPPCDRSWGELLKGHNRDWLRKCSHLHHVWEGEEMVQDLPPLASTAPKRPLMWADGLSG